MAVAEGFEPSDGGYPSHAFEACSLGRSDTPPRGSLPGARRVPEIASFRDRIDARLLRVAGRTTGYRRVRKMAMKTLKTTALAALVTTGVLTSLVHAPSAIAVPGSSDYCSSLA